MCVNGASHPHVKGPKSTRGRGMSGLGTSDVVKINCNDSDQKPKKTPNKTTVKKKLLINVHHRSSKRQH